MIEKLIDLRSDTVTKPSPEMREAMFNAIVGDDVFDEDPTVKALEEKAAKLFGHEAALFCPSGTMTNQIAIKILTQPQQEVICDRLSHIYYAEGGGVAFNSGVSMCLVDGDRGRISASHVADNVNPPQNIQQPLTSLVAVENTNNKGGGSCYTFKQLSEVAAEARKHNLKLHLDGARIFNAVVKTKDSTQEIGKLFDTISVCLSKGLGAPVGSLLITSNENLIKAKRVRKAFGGGMRQSGFLAAAGIYALDNNIDKLKDDHRRAKSIESILKQLNYVESCIPVDTNIIMFKLDDKKSVPDFLKYLSQNNIKGYQFGKQTVRFVTHLDFSDDMLDKLSHTLKKLLIIMSYKYNKSTVFKIIQETELVKRFFFKIPDEIPFNFKAGQFIMLNLPIASKFTNRSYSIASSPSNDNTFELAIVLNPKGLGTPYLWENIDVGSEIDVSKALGKFTLIEPIEEDICFVCTGTGIAPLRSMLHYILNNNIPHKKIYMIFGNRWEKDIIYRKEMEDLGKEYPSFEYIPVLSRDSDGWTGKKGYVHPIYEEIFSDKRPATFYMCGWRDMLHEARQRLEAMGYDRKKIKFESYD